MFPGATCGREADASPPLPMTTCGEPVSTPVCWSALSVTNTVQVGMTLLDLIIGIVASVATDLLFNQLPFDRTDPG
jgi:hypothetical protein